MNTRRYIKFVWVLLIVTLPSLLYCQSVGSKNKNPCVIPTITISPNPVTICIGGQVGLTASGGLTYVWTPAGSSLSCYNCSNPIASPVVTTTYTVVGTNGGGCSNTATVVVTVDPAPVIAINAPKDSICIGQNLTLTGTGGNTYNWTDGNTNSATNPLIVSPTITTTYTVTGTDVNGCTGSAVFTVYVSEPATINVTPNQNVCPGKSVTLLANQTSGSAITYKWEPGGSTNQIITVSPIATTVYTVYATNACGTVSKNVTVTVLPRPMVNFQSNPSSGCPSLCVQFKNFSSIAGGGISSYVWTFGNGDTAKTDNAAYCYPKPGVYTVSLTAVSDSGCSTTLGINNMITVFSKPVAKFTASPQPASILQSTIQFTNQSTDAYGIALQNWSFGDNGDSIITINNPQHTYGDTGTYCVKLGVMNFHGCLDTAMDCIKIDPIFAVYIPSAFSPNGDGLNEVFMPKGNDIKAFEMYIFDRWGVEVFHTTDMNEGWNGKAKGESSICSEDVYLYLIHVTDYHYNVFSYTGNVTLIR